MVNISILKHNFCVIVLILVFSLNFIANTEADTIYLKNGRSIEGIIKSEDAERVELDIGFGIVGFKRSQIERIERSSPEESERLREKWVIQSIEREKRRQEEEKRKELEPKTAGIQQEQGHIVVEALINQTIRATLVLDTGASFIVLTKETGRKLGIDARRGPERIVKMQVADGRTVNARYVLLDSVSVQGAEVRNVDAAIIYEDPQDPVFRESFKDGLLGMSFLSKFNFRIDQNNKQLILEKPK